MSIQNDVRAQNYHPLNPIGIVQNHPYLATTFLVLTVAYFVQDYVPTHISLLQSAEPTLSEAGMGDALSKMKNLQSVVTIEDADLLTQMGPFQNTPNKYFSLSYNKVTQVCTAFFIDERDPRNAALQYKSGPRSFHFFMPTRVEEICSSFWKEMCEFSRKRDVFIGGLN